MIKLIILNCISGFSNRILPLISLYSYCKDNNIELAIIWDDNTCRSCLDKVWCTYYNMNNYFKDIPKIIKQFKTYEDVLNNYKINNNQIHIINGDYTYKNIENFENNEYIYIEHTTTLLSFFNDNKYKLPSCLLNRNGHLEREYEEIYGNEFIKKISENFLDFTINDTINDNVKNVLNNFDKNKEIIGIQLRTTDGGFKKYNKDILFNNIYKIIENNITKYNIFFCTDDINNQNNILNKYNNIIIYNNNKKFINNNEGTFFALVDLYLLSNCDIIYGTPDSSFAFLSFLLNQKKNKKLKYISLT